MDKLIDKLMDNHWFLRGIALLLAVMLYITVTSLEKQPESTSTSLFPIGNITETQEDVELVAYYDQDKYIVSGIPETVNVTLEGDHTEILKLRQQFEVFVDLQGYNPGTYDVTLEYKDIPEDLEVKLDPPKIRVTIEKKVRQVFPVEIGYLNEKQIKDGYKVGEPSLKPESVEIVGTASQLEQVGSVKAYVDLKGVSETFTKQVKVYVYDKSDNNIDLYINPADISVTVPVISPEKTVPIKVTRKGSLPQGVTVTKITVNPAEATVYGSKDVLNDIEALEGIVVDLDTITEPTTFEADVPVPKGAAAVKPAKVKITIDVERQERKTITDIPVKPVGLEEQFILNFLNPADGTVSIDAVGEASVLSALSSSQIEASISVQNLEPGIHDIPIQLGSLNQVTLELNTRNVKIEIVKKS